MTDIIFIAFEFPPLTFGGVFRTLKFMKYLPGFGVRPHLYTLDPESYPMVYAPEKMDYELLDELKGKDIKIQRVPMDSVIEQYQTPLTRFFHIYFNVYRGNEYSKWEKHVIEEIENSSIKNIKAILVTAPPFGMLQIAEKIAKHLKLPLIIDMRDAWSFWNSSPYGSIVHYWITKNKERKHFSFAHKIIATTKQTIDDWRTLYPDIDPKKFEYISNGFDDEKNEITFKAFELSPLQANENFTIVYVGSFYYSPEVHQQMLKPFYKKKGIKVLHYFPRKQDWLYRTPYYFFKTIQAAFRKDAALKSNIKIKFAGRKEPWLIDMITEFDLQDNVELLGLLTHAESLQLQSEASALLITSAKVKGGKDCFVAGKTFEYLTMNKPILSFVSEGAQKDILEPSGVSVFFDPDNTEASAEQLMNLIKGSRSFNPNIEYIKTFERKKLAAKLADVIQGVIAEKG